MTQEEPTNERRPTAIGETRAEAWERFYAYCADVVRRCPDVRKLSAPDRDDCVQDVMYEIVRKFGESSEHDLSDPGKVTGWVLTVSHHKAIDITRRRYRHPVVSFGDGQGAACAAPGSGVEEAALSMGESVSLVWDALLDLDREVTMTSYLIFYLRTIEGWPTHEIARIFDLTPEKTKFRCHRVKKRFGEILKAKREAAERSDQG